MSLLIRDFTQGWQNKAQQEDMRDDALFRLVDLDVDILGTMTCRNLHGENSFFKGVDTTSEIDDVYIVDVEGAGKYLIYYRIGSSLYRWNSVTGATTTLSTAMSGGHVSYAPLKPILSDTTYVFLTDGTVQQADNGTSNKTWGIDPPTGSVTASVSVGAGNLSAGTYKYVYTYYDDATGSESDPSPATAEMTAAANDAFSVTNIRASGASRVTSRRLYRTIASGGSYYLVATIPDNSTTTFTDTIADASLSTLAETDQGVPPSGDVVLPYGDYLLMSGNPDFPNRVYFPLANKPDNWPSTYYIDVGTADDKVMNIVEFAGKVHFVQEAGIRALLGSNPDTFTDEQTRSHIGTYCRWSVAVGPDGIYFLTRGGVYRFNGVKSEKVSSAISRVFGHTPDARFEIVDEETAPNDARACFLNGTYYLLVPMKDTAGTITNKILSYDIVDQSWKLYDVPCNDITSDTGRGTVYGAKVKYNDSSKYMVYELFSKGTSTVDSASPEFMTKAYSMQDIGDYSKAKRTVVSGIEIKGRQDIGWLRKYRVDGLGTWTFTFYVDGVSRHEEEISGLAASNRNTWRDFPPNIKGRYLYVKGVASGTINPNECVIKEIEIK